jgi:hypothetical protein
MSVLYSGGEGQITVKLKGPTRNPPNSISLRFRTPGERPLTSVTVNGERWKDPLDEWVQLPGDIGSAEVVVRYAGP